MTLKEHCSFVADEDRVEGNVLSWVDECHGEKRGSVGDDSPGMRQLQLTSCPALC